MRWRRLEFQSRSLKSLCILSWCAAGYNRHCAAWHEAWCSDSEAFALLLRNMQLVSPRGWRWLANAAHVALLSSTRHRRLLSLGATYCRHHRLLHELNGMSLNASRVWWLLTAALLLLCQAARGWHGCCSDFTERYVARDCLDGSLAQRCGASRC